MSILDQTFVDFELIIVDDCSDDGSWEVLCELQNEDHRIRLFRSEENSGIAKTLNKALSESLGTYLLRMDSDDICPPHRLETQINFLKGSGLDICSTNLTFIDSSGAEIGRRSYSAQIDKVMVLESPIAHPTVLMKREVFEKYGNYRSEFDPADDYELWLRYYSNGCTFGLVEEYLYSYRQHEGQVKTNRTKQQLKATIRVKEYAVATYGIRLGVTGRLRLWAEKVLLLLPNRFVLWLFFLLKSQRS